MAYLRALTSAVFDRHEWEPGQVYEVDDATANAWCDGQRAERVSNQEAAILLRREEPETAVRGAPENTARRTGRPRS